MTKSYFVSAIDELLKREALKQEAFEQVEWVISEFARHHRDPELYNQSFLDSYNRVNSKY